MSHLAVIHVGERDLLGHVLAPRLEHTGNLLHGLGIRELELGGELKDLRPGGVLSRQCHQVDGLACVHEHHLREIDVDVVVTG